MFCHFISFVEIASSILPCLPPFVHPKLSPGHSRRLPKPAADASHSFPIIDYTFFFNFSNAPVFQTMKRRSVGVASDKSVLSILGREEVIRNLLYPKPP